MLFNIETHNNRHYNDTIRICMFNILWFNRISDLNFYVCDIE